MAPKSRKYGTDWGATLAWMQRGGLALASLERFESRLRGSVLAAPLTLGAALAADAGWGTGVSTAPRGNPIAGSQTATCAHAC